MNISLSPWYTKEHVDSIILYLKELWVSHIRREFDFFDQSKNNELQDYAITQFYESNITILWVLSGIVPWTFINLIKPSLTYTPIYKDFENFEYFTQGILNKYKNQITHRQIRNEQNTQRFWITKPHVEEYKALLLPIVQVIKNIQPQSIIVWWGLFYDPGASWVPNYTDHYLIEYYHDNLINTIDIHTIHPYTLWCYLWITSAQKLEDTIIDNIQYFKENFTKNKPLRITEFWISDKRTIYTPKQQAEIYSYIINYANSQNIPIFLRNMVDFRDKRHTRWNPEKYFWLLDKNLKPKTVFYELKQLLQ